MRATRGARRERCWIVAEAGVNHDGDPALAERLVDAAADAGADAVKFQTFRAERLATPDAPKPRYQKRLTPPDESQLELLRRLELDEAAHRALRERARSRGIELLSTPYDAESVALLDRIGVSRFKVASGEITNLPLLRCIGARGRPVVLSTGMSTLDEVRDAVATLRGAGSSEILLLHCTSSYPTDPGDCNLAAMGTLRRATGLPVGYSDHTIGDAIACAAVALGAVALEKHFTLDRSRPGPDHAASLEPEQLARLVRAVRDVERSLGSADKRPVASELENRHLARRGLVVSRDLAEGAVLGERDLLALRPADGLPPSELPRVLGRALRVPLACGQPLRWEHLG